MWLYEVISLIINALTLIVVVISVYYLYVQIKKTHDWNRREATQRFLLNLSVGEQRELGDRLRKEFDIDVYEGKEDYSDVVNRLTDEQKKELDKILKHILNYFEAASLSIKHNIYDEDICFQYISVCFVKYFDFCQQFIRKYRSIHPSVYIEFENYAKKWKKELEEWEREIVKSGKEKL